MTLYVGIKKFLCDKVCQWLQQVGGFLRVLRFPPPINKTDRHDIAEKSNYTAKKEFKNENLKTVKNTRLFNYSIDLHLPIQSVPITLTLW